MTRGASGAAWPQVRKGLIAHTKLMLSSFDTTGFRAMLAALENGEEVGLDGGSLGLVLGTIDPVAARQFNHKNDPENLRRFILTADDRLIETESFGPDSRRRAPPRGSVTETYGGTPPPQPIHVQSDDG